MRALVASVGLACTGCLTATEISVEVTTDVPCNDTGVQSTTISVGQLGPGLDERPAAASQTRCTDGYIGALVVVPSGANDEAVAFKVTTGVGKSADQCPAAGGPGCIVARRALRFLPHTRLDVPVAMRGSCVGVVCDPTSTCVMGACVPATVSDPSSCAAPGGCGEGALLSIADGGADATVDATTDGATDATTDGPRDASADTGPRPDGSTPTACGDTSGLQAGAPWPMDGYCPAKRRKSPYAGPSRTPTPHVKWSKKRAAIPQFAPLIAADGTIYMASDDMTLYAFDANGNQIARYPIPDSIQWAPAIGSDGNVYVPCGSAMYKVSPTIMDGGVLTGTPFSGYGARGNLTMAPGPTLLFVDGTATLFALDTAGAERWHHQFGAPTDYMSPTLGADGFVYQYLANGDLNKVLLADGGATRIGGVTASTSAHIAVAPDGNVRLSLVEAMQLASMTPQGTVAWKFPLVDAGAGQAFVFAIGDDSTTYLGVQTTSLLAIDRNGMKKWTGQTQGKDCWTATLDANEVVYAGCVDTIFALDPSNGSELWSLPLTPGTASAFSIAIGADNVLYVHTGTGFGTTDGTLWAIGN